MPAHTPLQIYQRRFNDFRLDAQALSKVNRRIADARLLSAIGIFIAGFFWWRSDSPLAMGAVLLGIASFAVLMVLHERRTAAQLLAESLASINEKGMARLEHRWSHFSNQGDEWLQPEHPYAQDLDIFGPGSLFQWIRSTHTPGGTARLASWLADPPLSPSDIAERQEAIAELAAELEWRQLFEASAMQGKAGWASKGELATWSSAKQIIYGRWATIIYRALPAITVPVLIAAWFLGDPWSGTGVFLVLVQFALWAAKAKANHHFSEALQKERDGLGVYEAMMQAAERLDPESPLLREMAWSPGSNGAPPPSEQRSAAEQLPEDERNAPSAALRRLKRLADWLEVRRQPLIHFPLNILLLWDARWIIKAEKWRREHGGQVPRWIEDLATLEALSSLAHIGWEHPDWVLPQLTESEPWIKAEEMGHPLLPDDRRITNDGALERPGSVHIITGSNMSGKSTYLRTLGINMILARLGTPVCARSFLVKPLHVYTSMRNADNLEKSISSFYAELLRVKMIVEAAKKGEPLLFLIDEIFRGTNSADRHTGAEAVIQKLSAMGAVGLVSTHDLDLASLAGDEDGKFIACHFSEYYEDGKLRFDYRLKPGVATTRNAMHLMRMVGIVDEETASSAALAKKEDEG